MGAGCGGWRHCRVTGGAGLHGSGQASRQVQMMSWMKLPSLLVSPGVPALSSGMVDLGGERVCEERSARVLGEWLVDKVLEEQAGDSYLRGLSAGMFLRHEPRAAWAAGPTGLEAYERIIPDGHDLAPPRALARPGARIRAGGTRPKHFRRRRRLGRDRRLRRPSRTSAGALRPESTGFLIP